MNYSHRIFLYGPFAMLVVLAAGVMIYWWIAATALATQLDALNGHAIAPGVHMRFAQKRIAGFPFRLDTIFTDFTLEIPGAHGPVVWHSNGLAAHTLAYSTHVTVFEAGGPQTITWTGQSGAQHQFAFTPGALRASAIVEDGKLARFDLDGISLAGKDLAAGRAQFHLRPDPVADALDIVFEMRAIHFAGDAAAGFPDGLSYAHLDGRLAPEGPFTPLLAGRSDWRTGMDLWRMKNGFLKVDQAAVFWRKCEATSSGNLAVDALHRLSGALSFSLAACNDLKDQAKGVTAPSGTHRAILTVLAALSAIEPPDQNGALPVTLVFRDGVIFVGPGRSVGQNSFFAPVGLLHPLY